MDLDFKENRDGIVYEKEYNLNMKPLEIDSFYKTSVYDKLCQDYEMKKRQHYVPQFYLRNFEDGGHKLHVYNRKKNIFFMSQVKDTGE